MTDVNLTFQQETRLREIARDRNGSWAGFAPVATQALRDLGFIAVCGERTAKTGRRMAIGFAEVTDAGREWLSKNPAV